MKRNKLKVLATVWALILLLPLGAGAAEIERLPRLTLVAPPGPHAIPAAYLVANDRLAAVAEKVELVIWENPAQVKAIVAGNQADFVILPANLAAILYNRGIKVQLLDISVWNVHYLLSTNPKVKTIADLRGERIAVPFKGAIPDLMLQILSVRQGIDPAIDFNLHYAANPKQSAQLLLSGVVQHALVPEPLATKLLRQQPERLHRAVRFDVEWERVVSQEVKTPLIGTVALVPIQDRPDIVKEFITQYRLAVEWVLKNPAAAGKMAERRLSQLGFKADPVAESIQYTTWKHVQARDVRDNLEAFFTIMMELSPGVVGGNLPGDRFYHPGVDLR